VRLLLLPSVSHSLFLSPSINICGWLMLALELSAEKGGLVLTAAIAVVKGQGCVVANRQLLHKRFWAHCPTPGEISVREGETDKRR